MKTTKYIVAAFSLILGLSSCYDLDVAPYDKVAQGNYWKTEADAKSGVMGVYAQLKNNGAYGYMPLFDTYSDIAQGPGGPVEQGTYNGAYDFLVQNWQDTYDGIQRANTVIKNVSGMDSRVVSPLSVTYLMGMLANGADGQTRQEILTTPGWDKGAEGQNALEEANELACMMLQSLSRQDKAITVDVANFVAVNNQVKLKEGFQRTVTDYYKAGVEALDFASPKALKRINGWCSDRTHGMIPSIIDRTNPQDVSYLMNAIYFNGSWTDKFDKRETKVEPFRGYTRDIKRVNMMHRNDKYFFANSQDFDAVQIPYGDRSFQMMVLLPHVWSI